MGKESIMTDTTDVRSQKMKFLGLNGFHVRWMIRRDMADIVRIENESFEFPWSEEEFIRCLRQRNCIGMVGVLSNGPNDKVVGYMIYELHKSRLNLLNLAVDKKHRRLGIGECMIEKLQLKLHPQRRSRLLLEVRETNLAAQLFFRSQGLRAISVLHDYYNDSPEDAYVMQYRCAEEPTPAEMPDITVVSLV